MSVREKENRGHSVFQRLLNLAKAEKTDFNMLLVRYGVERLLYRLSISSYSRRFILKGASLFLVWRGQNFRVTRDVDLLCFGTQDLDHMEELFRGVCGLECPEDGVLFSPETVKLSIIRGDQEYSGLRITLNGSLHGARIPVQVDVGFGDVVTPNPEPIRFPTLLDGPAPEMLAYPRHTMVAEKLEALVRLGIASSRMKDIYDLSLLSKLFVFEGGILLDAVIKTFNRRKTDFPDGAPMALSEMFAKDRIKKEQWNAFIRKANPEMAQNDLQKAVTEVTVFLLPILESARRGCSFDKTWEPGGAWRSANESH
ncbi:MAG: nucleotidyl transferase AbiEii/AbiGii toxin family protein [Proteobacteria bacterium]|nr:nucleotidyl transferase AbiEii/AbiGii toxin family protein [Pseudomonadota bacterium]